MRYDKCFLCGFQEFPLIKLLRRLAHLTRDVAGFPCFLRTLKGYEIRGIYLLRPTARGIVILVGVF